ncbi:MAG: serine/threonine-protein kinase [Lysobacterales bacterium]
MSSTDSLASVHALFDRLVELPQAIARQELTALGRLNPGLVEEVQRLLALDARIGAAEPMSAVAHAAELLEHLGGPAVEPGHEIGIYRIEAEIGSGGMGRVYRAARNDGSFEREVAIKLIRRDLVSALSMQRFAAERRILATLDHPGIVRLLDAGVLADGAPFVIMELVRGESITGYCDVRGAGLEARVRLFRQVLDALAHAHRRLIVHRDLKPDNILVDESGQVRLLDFGIAKALDGDISNIATATGDRHFTPAYASPEQLRGEPTTVGCDIYALGLVLYELLGGNPPFPSGQLGAAELERQVLLLPPRELARVPNDADEGAALAHGFASTRAWRRALRGDLDAIVQRALRKEVDARYGSADEFAADIDAWLSGRPLATRQSQRAYRVRKFVARNRVGVTLAATALLLLFAFTGVVLRQNRALADERDRTALERDRARQSVQILQEAFESADPSRTGGKDVSARSVLEAARARLPATAQGNPQLALELARTIATVQIDLGLARDALATVAVADAVISRQDTEPTVRVEHELLRLRALLGAGDFDGTEKTIALAKKLARPEDAAALHMALGRLLTQRGQIKPGIAELEQAVAAYAKAPDRQREWIEASWHLAGAFDLGGDYHQSLAVLEGMLPRLEREFGPDHPHTLATQLRRSGALRSLGFGTQALDEVRKATLATERIYGKESTAAATARISLGNLLTAARDYPAAAHEYRTALAAWPAAAGQDHPNLFRARFNLAQVLAEIPENYAESEALYTDLLGFGERSFGRQHRTVYLLRSGHAYLLNQQLRFADALLVLLPKGAEAADAGWRSGAKDRYFEDLRISVEGARCTALASRQAQATPAPKTATPTLLRLCARATALLEAESTPAG